MFKSALIVGPASAKSPNTAASYLPVLVALASLQLFLWRFSVIVSPSITTAVISVCRLLHMFNAISQGSFRTCTTGVPKFRFCDRTPRLRPVKPTQIFHISARRVGLVGQNQREARYLAFCPLEFLPLALLSFLSSASRVC
jgi:hypothetical protein